VVVVDEVAVSDVTTGVVIVDVVDGSSK